MTLSQENYILSITLHASPDGGLSQSPVSSERLLQKVARSSKAAQFENSYRKLIAKTISFSN
jgi:hypothetical protein